MAGGGGGLLHKSHLFRFYCNHKHRVGVQYRRRLYFAVLSSCLLWFVLFHQNLPGGPAAPTAPTAPPVDRCAGRYVYAHDVPSRFNSDILRHCRALSQWTDMCRFLSNDGLGPPLHDDDGGGGSFSGKGWYNTNQFALEVIFHNRMKQYECLTADSSKASAVYVPFYPGLDVARYLWGYNVSVRDAASLDLIRWLKSRPEWAAMGGKDHFLVAGRITWDFRRLTDGEYDWGSKFLLMPETRNMTVLVIESSPWHGNDFGIPYPTYFHPSMDGEVFAWQDRVRSLERPWLFSFAGAPRPNDTSSIRGRLIEQCAGSERCNLLDCGRGVSKCHSPGSVMGAFESSVFCLQPQGDSYTRRSTFDAMVAGCIPVLFHPGSAYVQYAWHLPRDYAKYSVFIPEEEVREGKVKVEEVLRGYSEEEVRRMREEVIRMIPRLVYADPRSKMESVKDAFDVAIEGVIGRVEKVRKRMTRLNDRGLHSSPAPLPEEVEDEANSWKYALGIPAGEHEWDHFFHKP